MPELETSWRPLLSGRLEEGARETVAAIAAALESDPTAVVAGTRSDGSRPLASVSLSSGSPGWALYFAYGAESLGGEFCASAVRNLVRATDALTSVPMSPGLYGGFPGIAWTAAHLSHRVETPFSSDSFDELDAAITEYVSQSPWRRDFDLLQGLVGIGVYALERLPLATARTTLERIVDRLEETAEPSSGGLAWRTPSELAPEPSEGERTRAGFNLGMAHGLPGVIAFLAMAYAAEVSQVRVRSLAARAVDALLANKLLDGSRSHFGSMIGLAGSMRTAWCYGDPGPAAALCLAGRSMGEPDWEAAGLAVARSIARRPFEWTGVEDCALCHGASGVAHILNRLSQLSGDASLGEASRAWFARILEMRRPQAGIAGFEARSVDQQGRRCWVSDPGFLTGSAGIGLALLAAVSDVEPAWDRLLLLSGL